MSTPLVEEVKKEFEGIKGEFLEANQKLAKQIVEAETEAKNIRKDMTEEQKRLAEISGETAAALSKAEARYDQGLADLKGKFEEYEAKSAEFQAIMDSLEADAKKRRSGTGLEPETVEAILASDEGKQFLSWCPQKAAGNASPRLYFRKGFDRLIRSDFVRQAKTITGGADMVSVFGNNLVQMIKASPRLRAEHLRDHMTVIPAPDIGKVEYVKETGYTNNAGFQSAEGAAKALSDITFEKQTGLAKTIAHGTPISRQLWRHAPMVQGWIEDRLMNGLYDKEDTALLLSDGSGGSYEGLTQVTGVQDYADHPDAYTNIEGAAPTKLDIIRRAFTLVQNVHLVPDIAVVNIFDWEKMELTKDAERRYVNVAVPGPNGLPLVWRVPVFATTAMTADSFMVAALRQCATLWETEEAFVQVFREYSDYALKNLLLLLAEMEEILTVEIAEGIVSGTFTEAS